MRRSRADKLYKNNDKSTADEEINRQRWRNNLLGLMVLILVFLLATDIGGCATGLSHMLIK